MTSPLELALVSCALLGLRHGFDYDHLAAISDITSVQTGWWGGMRFGLLYALGHALTVAILGAGVIFLHLSLPEHLDMVGERLVGATLIVLAIYVIWSFWRLRRRNGAWNSHSHISKSRIALLVSAGRYLAWRARRVVNPELDRPESFTFRYDQSSVFGVGIVHGLGAETPSQLMLFLLAANLGGTSRGFLGLLCFLLGLLIMNTAMTASASGIFASSSERPRLRLVVTSVTVLYSFAVGIIFLTGTSARLPALLH